MPLTDLMPNVNQFSVPIGAHLFDMESLDQIVHEAIPSIPSGKTGAIVATTDTQGVRVALEITRGADNYHWSAEFAYAHDWNGDNKLGGKVMFSW